LILSEITFLDLLISVLIIAFSIFIANFLKPDSSQEYSKFYFKFVFFKIFTAILFVLIHVFYYKGGDTFLYFSGGTFFCDQFYNDPITYFKILFTSQSQISNIVYTSSMVYALNSSGDVFFLCKIISIFNILTLNCYLASSILYTLVTAIGIWKLYSVLCQIYPSLSKLLAIGILFYPSLGIWGSGILKDPLTLCCVGLLFSSTYAIVNGRNYFSSIILISMSIYFCFILKPYILYTFVPIMLLWSQGQLSAKLKNPIFKAILTPIILVTFSLGGFYAINSISEGAGKYSLDSVQSVAEGFQSWHTYLAETRDQSGYSLGEVEFTIAGILKKAPEGFWVTYYRPFIFGDVRNIATLFEAVQTFILLVLTVFVFLRVGIFKTLKIMLFDKNVRMFMLFAIVFGVAVGITSYNFGALSRYKIPSLPFFTASLAIIYHLGYLKPKKGY
jgi:hypothetical protein